MANDIRSILIASAYFPPHMGGVEVFSRSLAHELASRGVGVTCIASRVDDAPTHEVLDDGVEVYRLPANDPTGRYPVLTWGEESKRLRDELRARAFDGIVVNTRFYPISLFALRLAMDAGIQPVLIEQGSSYLSIGNPAVDLAIRRYEDAIGVAVRASKPKCYGVSIEAGDWMRKFGLEPSGTIHNAIDADAFATQASNRDFRAEHNIPADACLVAFTGRLIPEKGIWTLVQVARAFEKEDVFFLVAGDGPERPKLERLSPTNVKCIGRIDRADVAALLSQADAFCFPSEYPEGLPTSLLEAAACGAYIITAPVAGAREVVPGAEFGCVMPDASAEAAIAAIRAMCADTAATRKAAMRCRDHVRAEFCWSKTADAVLQACAR